MNRQQRRKQGRDRHFRVQVVPRQNPDLHKLAQVFLGMAVARAEREKAERTMPHVSRDAAPETEVGHDEIE